MSDNVVSDLMAKVPERYYGGDESKIPAIDYLGVKPAPVPLLPGAHVLRTGNEVKLTPPASLISPILFVAFLSLVLARRLSSACSVTSLTNSPL